MVGLLYLTIGTLRLGFLVNFLSHSVLSGFTTGAAAVIGISQVQALDNYEVCLSLKVFQVPNSAGVFKPLLSLVLGHVPH